MRSLGRGRAAYAVVVLGLALITVAARPAPGDPRAFAAAPAAPATPAPLQASTALSNGYSRPAEVDPATPPPPVVSAATSPTPAPAPATPAGPVNVGPVYAVGDSVLIDIAPALSRDIPGITVNGKVSRQFGSGVQVIAALRTAGRLPPTVIVELGTNGTVTPTLFDAMMAASQGARAVVFCTVHVPRSWEAGDNAVIRAGVARHPNARLADWWELSRGHPEWFAPDGFHVDGAGARAYAALIASIV